MKLKWFAFLGLSGTLIVLSFGFVSASADQVAATSPFLALSSVPVPEIPAKAAELVAAATTAERVQTAQSVLRAASVVAKPGVLPYVVSSICRRDPALAGATIATAIELKPDFLMVFLKAALSAAPDQVEQIVFSACKAAPSFSGNVALAASRQIPAANNQILSGFANSLPGLQRFLEQAEIRVGTNDAAAVIDQTARLWEEALKESAK